MTGSGRRAWLAAGLALLLAASGRGQAAEPVLVIEDNDFLGPGGTDVQALLPLLGDPNVSLLGATVVTGDGWENAEAAHVLRFLEIAGRPDIPVADGAAYPLINSPARMRAWEQRYGPIPWHGAWGGDGPIDRVSRVEPAVPFLPEGAPRHRTAAEPAALFMIRQVHAHPHQVVVVEAGPMTNLALAIRLDPSFAATAKRLVFMGGSVDTDVVAVTGAGFAFDFNLAFDPEAAHIVLTADWPQVVSLGKVAGTVMMTRSLMDRITAAARTPLTDYLGRYRMSLPLWDEMTAAVAADPTLITRSVDAPMDVDLADGLDYGRAHVWTTASAPRGTGLRLVTMVQQVDTRRFLDGFVRDAQMAARH